MNHPVPNLHRRTCPRSLPWCGSHVGNRSLGPCIGATLVVPAPGHMEAVVYRQLDVDGTRTTDMSTWDDSWQTGQSLPDDPPAHLADAVEAARKFLTETRSVTHVHD